MREKMLSVELKGFEHCQEKFLKANLEKFAKMLFDEGMLPEGINLTAWAEFYMQKEYRR